MPKVNCIAQHLDEMCLQFCKYVDECPSDAECYYRMQVREIIENILDDDTDNGVDQA